MDGDRERSSVEGHATQRGTNESVNGTSVSRVSDQRFVADDVTSDVAVRQDRGFSGNVSITRTTGEMSHS